MFNVKHDLVQHTIAPLKFRKHHHITFCL